MKNVKMNWFMVMFVVGWIILFLAPEIPYRSVYLSDTERLAMSKEEKRAYEEKELKNDVDRGRAKKVEMLGFTLVYGGLVLTFAKIIADAIAIRRREDK